MLNVTVTSFHFDKMILAVRLDSEKSFLSNLSYELELR